jgi:hypothetical protein
MHQEMSEMITVRLHSFWLNCQNSQPTDEGDGSCHESGFSVTHSGDPLSIKFSNDTSALARRLQLEEFVALLVDFAWPAKPVEEHGINQSIRTL